MKQQIEKITLTKTELMQFLGIGELRLSRLIANPNFPRKKPILNKWIKNEVINYYNNLNTINQNTENEDSIMKFLGE